MFLEIWQEQEKRKLLDLLLVRFFLEKGRNSKSVTTN